MVSKVNTGDEMEDQRWGYLSKVTPLVCHGMSGNAHELRTPVPSLHDHAITLLFSAIVMLYAVYLSHFFREKGILIGSSYTLAQTPIVQIYTTIA